MKKSLLTALLFATSSAAVAQYYEPIPYYNNNPYIFCTVGVPQDCWAPISKELGTFTVTNYYCFNAYSAFQIQRIQKDLIPFQQSQIDSVARRTNQDKLLHLKFRFARIASK